MGECWRILDDLKGIIVDMFELSLLIELQQQSSRNLIRNLSRMINETSEESEERQMIYRS